MPSPYAEVAATKMSGCCWLSSATPNTWPTSCAATVNGCVTPTSPLGDDGSGMTRTDGPSTSMRSDVGWFGMPENPVTAAEPGDMTPELDCACAADTPSNAVIKTAAPNPQTIFANECRFRSRGRTKAHIKKLPFCPLQMQSGESIRANVGYYNHLRRDEPVISVTYRGAALHHCREHRWESVKCFAFFSASLQF